MAVVRAVQMARHEVVVVDPVRNDRVAAGHAVLVRRHVAAAAVAMRAGFGVGGVDGEAMVVNVVAVRVMDVAVVDVVHVAFMVEPAVAAMQPMLVGMMRMLVARLHQVMACPVLLLNP